MLELLQTLRSYYIDFLPPAGIAAALAFLLAPLAAHLARRTGMIDQPATTRKTNNPQDTTASRRIHTKPTPKTGGLAVIIPLFALSAWAIAEQPITQTTPQLLWLIAGVLTATILTIIDIKKNLSGPTQLIGLSIAALLIQIGGTRFTEITLIGFPLDRFVIDLPLHATLSLPADILNLFFILLVANAINWLFSVDAVGEIIVAISIVGLLLTNVKLDNLPLAMICAIFLGAILGYLPWNLPPAKLFSGTDQLYGFLIAIISILSDGKLLIASSILILPLLDMSWVMTFRILRHHTLNPRTLLSISDTTHIAHRLRDIGLSTYTIIAIEAGIVLSSVTIALAILNLATAATILIQIILVLAIFIAIHIARTKQIKK